MKLFYQPHGRLRLSTENLSYLEVKTVWASPMSYPTQFLAFLDGKGKEIATIKHPEKVLNQESWRVAKQELDGRYLNGTIDKILEAKLEFGYTYWSVETPRGHREFVTYSLQENANWMSDVYLVVIDVDGNRFEIPDITKLDEKSRKILANTV